MIIISVFYVSRVYSEDCTWNNSRSLVFSLLDPAPVTFSMLVSCSQLLSAHLDGDRVDDLIV